MDACNTGVILIDAPTGSGKTRYIKALGATPSNTLTSEQLVEELVLMCQNESSLDHLAEKLRHITYIENMESLCGKEETQRLAAQLVRIMAASRQITLTGIHFPQKVPFFLEALGPYQPQKVISTHHLGREQDLWEVKSNPAEPIAQPPSPNPVIGSFVKVMVDRPLGSAHPDHPDMIYPINYGFIEGVLAPDGEAQDAYILGVHKPIEQFTGIVIAIVHRINDVEDKWVVAPAGETYSMEDIIQSVAFQEQFFQTEILM